MWLELLSVLPRVGIQRGPVQFFPPEALGANIGPVPVHTNGRNQSLDFRAGVALSLHFGLELDVRHLATRECAQVQAWIALHKRLRAQLRHSPALCLPMLHLERRYRITRLDPPGMVPASAVLDAALHQRLRGRHTHMAHGAWLIHTGLTLARKAAESGQINQFQSIAAS